MKTKSINTSRNFSFSVILETENLLTVSPDSLLKSIKSLEGGKINPKDSNEFILINTGLVPEHISSSLKNSYPWIRVMEFPEEVGYYESKWQGFNSTSGDIVVFCDSDCEYHQGWLDYSLESFINNPRIQVVGGETSLRINNPMDLAMLPIWIFRPFSNRKEIYKSKNFKFNNVVFRRELIENHSFLQNVNLYRSDGVVYFQKLTGLGVDIWNNPKARTYHARPGSFKEIFWRLVLNSHSNVFRRCLNGQTKVDFSKISLKQKINAFFGSSIKWVARPYKRISMISGKQVQNWFFWPAAIPIVLVLQIILIGGTLGSLMFPKYIFSKAKMNLEREEN